MFDFIFKCCFCWVCLDLFLFPSVLRGTTFVSPGAIDRFWRFKADLCFWIWRSWKLVRALTISCSACLRIRLISDLNSLSALILARALYCKDLGQDPLSECLLRALIASSLCSISFSGESVSLRRRLRPIWSLLWVWSVLPVFSPTRLWSPLWFWAPLWVCCPLSSSSARWFWFRFWALSLRLVWSVTLCSFFGRFWKDRLLGVVG